MASNKDNLIFEKTSFLQAGNSSFIKELYLKFLEDPRSIPQSWTEFFQGLDEDHETIKKELLGPSWSPRKKVFSKVNLTKETQPSINGESFSDKSLEKEKNNRLRQ